MVYQDGYHIVDLFQLSAHGYPAGCGDRHRKLLEMVVVGPGSGSAALAPASTVPANWRTSGLALIGITLNRRMFTIEGSAAGLGAAASAASSWDAPATLAQRRDRQEGNRRHLEVPDADPPVRWSRSLKCNPSREPIRYCLGRCIRCASSEPGRGYQSRRHGKGRRILLGCLRRAGSDRA